MKPAIVFLVAALALAAAILFFAGAISFQQDDQEMSITIDKERVEENATGVIEKTEDAGRDLIHESGKAVKQVGEELEQQNASGDN